MGCSSSPFAMPSMVVTFEPAAWPASTVQDFTARPSIWTTQAPHWLVSQPTWVPVRFRWSRRRLTRSVRSSTSAETALPLTVNLTVDTLRPPDVFLVVPIRSTGAGLCNWQFRRQSHCYVVFHRERSQFAWTTPREGEASRVSRLEFAPFSGPELMVCSSPDRLWRKPRTPNNNAARKGFFDVIDKHAK